MKDAKCRPIHLLLIEDNPADARITMEAIKEAGIAGEITLLRHGDEAEAFLHRRGQYAAAERPDLILLDLNLPGKGGREILAAIKQDPSLGSIPVIVLSTSQAEQDVRDSYAVHANCYLVKPLSYQRLLDLVLKIGDFWLGTVKLPPKEQL
ncbi:MAG: response regulator [Desulfobacteraceae bacterium]|nr:response regulator [Desulfobacteraceae bacterium]